MNGESPTDRSVLVTLFDHSPLTRPELAAHTGLSRPTISDAVRRLGDAGLILEAGQRRGGLGRVPTMYRLAPTAGYVLAVDIGGDNTRVAVADPVVLDNNVNMAALGERWRGHARNVGTFAFLAVGAGIGMGLVHNGELVRGAHGAAGEVAYLPLPGVPPPAQRVGHGKQ